MQHASLSAYGWTAELEELFSATSSPGLVPGRLTRVDLGRADVVVPDAATGGLRTVRADTRLVVGDEGLDNPCTGDWAAVDLAAPTLPAVTALLPRRTAVVRKGVGERSQGQVLAANVDNVLVAVSLAVAVDLGRIERFLALAWSSGAQPIVVLTKADLADEPDEVRFEVEQVAPGATVLVVSAETGEGIDVLRACAQGTTALVGASGVGKSTLVNVLSGSAAMAVQHTRDVDEKGRHTTTTREMIPLPAGGVLIDTPGLRSVGLFGGEGVSQAFADVEEFAAQCRFPDCEHRTEPDCAVLAAVADGTLPQRRFDSFKKLERENERIAALTDARLAKARRDVWKARHQGAKMAMRAKGRPTGN